MANLPTPIGDLDDLAGRGIALPAALATSAFQPVRYGVDGVWTPRSRRKANARRRSFNASQLVAHLWKRGRFQKP
jgi:hypothetical protein